MNENSDLLPNLAAHEDAFEVQLRGYSRRQVDDFVARCRSQVRELEERLGRSLDEGEQLRQEVKALRQQALGSRPAHEEVSERIAQILKLADDEAHAQKTRADDEIRKQRSDAQQEADRVRKEARDQAEQMLTAAQEQAERAISAARADADKTRTTARTEADHTTAEARKKADNVLSTAKAQAKSTLDEATARATAIHDGAERRLNLLSTRHAETIRRLTEILDGVSGLVASETARLSLEDEVDQAVAKAIGQPSEGKAPAAPGTEGTPGNAANAANGSMGTPAGGQRGPAAGGPAGAPPLPAQGVREGASAGAGRNAPPAPPAGPGKSGTAPMPSVRGAHEAPRGGAHQAGQQAPGQPAGQSAGQSAQATANQPVGGPAHGDRANGPAAPGDQPRTSGPHPGAGTPAGPGGSRTEEPAGRMVNGPAGTRRQTAGDGYTGAIDADEATEGVRIVREQRQR